MIYISKKNKKKNKKKFPKKGEFRKNFDPFWSFIL